MKFTNRTQKSIGLNSMDAFQLGSSLLEKFSTNLSLHPETLFFFTPSVFR